MKLQNDQSNLLLYMHRCFILQSYWSVLACEAQSYKMIKFIIIHCCFHSTILLVRTCMWNKSQYPHLNMIFTNNIPTVEQLLHSNWKLIVRRAIPFCHSVILPFCRSAILHFTQVKKTSTLQQCNSVLKCKEMQLNWRPGTHLLGDLDYTI